MKHTRLIITICIFLCTKIQLYGEVITASNLRANRTHETAIVPPPIQGHIGPIIHSLNPDKHESLGYWLEYYQNPRQREWIHRALKRGLPYRCFIRSTIREYEIPWELEFLPVIESEFRSYAVSRSGAAGLWQFMTNSISPYGISIDEWMDERRDFWKATHGALRKLRDNYRETGDWLLALAAYNCGMGRMNRAIEQSGSRDFWELTEGGYLPNQTVQYVPKVLAISHIASHAGRYGLPTSWDEGIQWVRIELDQAVDLSILAKESGVPRDILATGNTELRYGITPPAGSSYFLKVPQEYSDVIKETLSRQDMQFMRFYLHTIQSGDTYYALSKHFGVSVAMIERYNPGMDPQFLRIGSTVVVPAIHNVGPYTRQKTVDQTLQPVFDGVYTVQPGDSLWSISRLYDISPEILALNNNLEMNGVLYAGTVIQVPEVSILREAGLVR